MANAKELLEKYRNGTCTEAEKQLVERWWLYFRAGEPTDLPEEREQQLLDEMDTFIRQRTGTKQPVPGFKWYYATAAILLVALATALYFNPGLLVNRNSSIVNQEILPGYNQATLTLADGTKVALDSAQSGIIINDENIKYNNGNPVQNVVLSSEGGKKGKGAEGSLPPSLTLSTPKGGQYQIILSDGTKVWLNAASTLKYPSKFTGDKREVFLEGEGYFEIKEDKTKPFKVLSKNQAIEVLGTAFNLAAYADDPAIRTTLVSGAIQVSSPSASNGMRLSPGDQTILLGSHLRKQHADVEAEIAWKNGFFQFNEEPLESIMRKIARWYNVDVVFVDNELRQKAFVGVINRFSRVNDVLDLLTSISDVQFSLNGRQITVSKAKQ